MKDHDLFIPTPEVDLLLACTRLHMDAAQAALVHRLAGHVDWSTVYRLADQHGVLPLLARHLPGLNLPNLPAWLLPRMQARYAAVAQRNLLRARTIASISHHLTAAGIPTLFYKGALTAATLYGDLALRPFGDVDVLVHAGDLPPVCDLLPALGYHPAVTHPDLARIVREYNEWSFLNAQSQVAIDLHWRVSPPTLAPLLREDDLWARAVTVELLPGATVTTYSPADQLLVLTVHAAKSSWHRLKWIGDFAAWLHHHAGCDGSALLHEAARLGCRRILLTSVCLAHRLLDAPLPPPLHAAIDDDPQVAKLVRVVAGYLWQTPSPLDSVVQRYLLTLRLHPRLLEQPGHRVHYLGQRLRQLLVPNDRDRVERPLPPYLHFLYWGIRPWRLWKKYVMGKN